MYRDIDNLSKMTSAPDMVGAWDIPIIQGVETFNAEGLSFIGFNEVRSFKGIRANTAVHFFIDDYQFARIWACPEKYARMLEGFRYVFTPDYSLYTDMPIAQQLWQHYRKQWVGAFFEAWGLPIIPTLGWSDERSYPFAFEGFTAGQVVAVSSVGVMRSEESKRLFKEGYNKAVELCKPSTILYFGQMVEGLTECPIINYPHLRDKHFKEYGR